MASQKQDKKLAKTIWYMLARSPGEFGLVPDGSGYVKVKELVKALNEEEGWRHVRASMLNILSTTLDDVPFEISGDLVRAKERGDQASKPEPANDPPAILYTPIRQRAYPATVQRGISPSFADRVVLSPDRTLAQRIGKRRDPDPVILAVETARAIQMGVAFKKQDDHIFLAEFIPPGCFSGPAVEKTAKKQPRKGRLPGQVRENAGQEEKTPGSFFMESAEKPDRKRKGKKKEIGWKMERRARSKKRPF